MQAGDHAQCVGAGCGNGLLDADEGCDDGNQADGDGCDSNCTETGCGNGIMTEGEGCDDGNDNDADACTNVCELARCGDSIEPMDLDESMADQDGFEACDDGNDDDHDGCNSQCMRFEIEDNDTLTCDSTPIPTQGKLVIHGLLDANQMIDAETIKAG